MIVIMIWVRMNVKWIWIKAHAGNPLNEEVDLLAKKAANLD